jgi:hypothetical protein
MNPYLFTRLQGFCRKFSQGGYVGDDRPLSPGMKKSGGEEGELEGGSGPARHDPDVRTLVGGLALALSSSGSTPAGTRRRRWPGARTSRPSGGVGHGGPCLARGTSRARPGLAASQGTAPHEPPGACSARPCDGMACRSRVPWRGARPRPRPSGLPRRRLAPRSPFGRAPTGTLASARAIARARGSPARGGGARLVRRRHQPWRASGPGPSGGSGRWRKGQRRFHQPNSATPEPPHFQT